MKQEFNPHSFLTWSTQVGAPFFESDELLDDFTYKLTDNKSLLDLSSTSFHTTFGLRPRFLLDTLKQQSDIFSTANPKRLTSLQKIQSQKLIELIGTKGKIFYTVSGAESTENAIKMARLVTKKKTFLVRQKSYHGASLGALTLTGDWRKNDHTYPDDWHLVIPEPLDDPDLKETEKLILRHGPENICGFFLETITGGNGIIIPSKSWWKKVQQLCQRYNILLILDEVVCGFGRLEKPFGFLEFDLKPDIVTMAKGITAGIIPFGAVWLKDSLSNYFNQNVLSCGLTNYAHPLGLAVMGRIIDELHTNEFKNHWISLQTCFQQKLKSLEKHSKVQAVRHHGLLAAIDHSQNITFKDLINKGLFCLCRPNQLILAPALNMPTQKLENAMQLLEELIDEK